ncbi:arginase family protein [Pseudonocardia xinjiangensis]|uniref:arginase family protein n=1 Tax=Pseudonocardia xinjiangensis TaxID=75289 RepID=UPI003D89B1A9
MTVIAVPFHLDEHLPALELPLAPQRSIAPPELGPGSPWERMAVLYDEVADAVAADVTAGRVPLVLSGDCTTSLGVVAGLQRAGLDPALVWFDGHGDVQTPETSASGYLGGMPVRQLVGGADRTVAERIGLRVVPEPDVLLVDARDLDPPEEAYLATSAIRRVPVADVGTGLPPHRPVYLHLDVDVVDARDLPGLLFPVPDGPRLPAVAAAVRHVLASCEVVAIGLACTWRPGSGADRAVAELVRELTAGT